MARSSACITAKNRSFLPQGKERVPKLMVVLRKNTIEIKKQAEKESQEQKERREYQDVCFCKPVDRVSFTANIYIYIYISMYLIERETIQNASQRHLWYCFEPICLAKIRSA